MRGIAAVLYREYRFRRTNVTLLFWDIFVPLSYLLLFGFGFQRSFGDALITGSQANYASFFLPGILSMTCFNIAFNTSWRFFTERENGIFLELLTYPISRQELVIGKILFNILLALVGCFLAILAGIPTLDVEVNWANTLPVIAGLVFGTAGWFFFFTILATRIRRNDVYNAITSFLYIVLMFAGSLFYPLESLPDWFRAPARMNPMTWQTDYLRYWMIGSGDSAIVIAETIAFLAFTGISFALAVRAVGRAAE